MKTASVLVLTCLALAIPFAAAGDAAQKDLIETSAGELEITILGHGTLMFTFAGKVIHIDPYSRVADYATLPDADLVVITHHHGDHLDPAALEQVRRADTVVILTGRCAEKVDGGTVMRNGDVRTAAGIEIEAVPAYNLVHMRDNGQPFHPKGEGNGYVMTFGDTRVYVAGDTENHPEMKALESIDYAFLPMNLPYTMTPEMVADAAIAFKPAVLYPYHYGRTEVSRIVELLAAHPEIEVRIREME